MLQALNGARRSLTIWVNAVTLAALPLVDYVGQNLPALQAYLPENAYKTAAFWLVVANMVLRFKTSKPLSEK